MSFDTLWRRQSCLQPAFQPAGLAGKQVRSLKGCPAEHQSRNKPEDCSTRGPEILIGCGARMGH
jgi:hypothetical protein